MRKREHKTNAARQAAYRARKRNVTPASVAIADDKRNRDYVDADGFQHIYLGNWGYGPQFARVIG